MKTLPLKDGDAFLIRWGLHLEMNQCEDFAALYFGLSGERNRERDLELMRDNLADMRRCHELRVKLSAPSRPRVARRSKVIHHNTERRS